MNELLTKGIGHTEFKDSPVGKIPKGWEVKMLGDVVKFSQGVQVDLELQSDVHREGLVPFLRIENFTQLSNDIRYIPELYSRGKFIQKDNVVMVRYGASAGFVGRGREGVLANNLFVVLPNKQLLIGQFLYLHLLSSFEMFQNLMAGGAMPALNFTMVSSIKVSLPPLPEQQKIASILTSVDEVIEKTQSQINKLQDLKKGTMNELLTKGIGHTEFKDSPVGKIPVEWEVKQVQDFARVIRGASPRPKGDPRFYGGDIPRLMVSDVTRDGKYVFPNTDSLTEEGKKLSRPLKKGALTIVCSGTVGVPSILGVDACIHDGFLGVVEITENCTTEFLYYNFLPLQSVFDSSATHGGIFTNLTTEILKEFIVAIPPLPEQQKIASILSSMDSHIEEKQRKLEQTQSLKKSLMQDLLTGKVRVTVN